MVLSRIVCVLSTGNCLASATNDAFHRLLVLGWVPQGWVQIKGTLTCFLCACVGQQHKCQMVGSVTLSLATVKLDKWSTRETRGKIVILMASVLANVNRQQGVRFQCGGSCIPSQMTEQLCWIIIGLLLKAIIRLPIQTTQWLLMLLIWKVSGPQIYWWDK